MVRSLKAENRLGIQSGFRLRPPVHKQPLPCRYTLSRALPTPGASPSPSCQSRSRRLDDGCRPGLTCARRGSATAEDLPVSRAMGARPARLAAALAPRRSRFGHLGKKPSDGGLGDARDGVSSAALRASPSCALTSFGDRGVNGVELLSASVGGRWKTRSRFSPRAFGTRSPPAPGRCRAHGQPGGSHRMAGCARVATSLE